MQRLGMAARVAALLPLLLSTQFGAAASGWPKPRANAADGNPSSAVQAMLDQHARKMNSELEGQLEGLLRQQRELLLSAPVVAGGKFDPQYYSKASRRSTFLAGALTAALLLGAIGWGWARFTGRRMSIVREALGDAVLETQQPDVVKRLIAQATKQRELPAWVTFPDFERVEWINAVIAQMWPHAASAIVSQVREQLDPQIKAAKPRWIGDISLTEFNFGRQPPRVKGIKVYPGEKTGDDVVVETDAVWASSTTIALRVRLLPDDLPLIGSVAVMSWITKFLSKLVFVKMGVTNVSFSGRVRTTLTAISDRLPVVGSLQVSLVEMPRFSFGITLYEYLNLMVLPGLEAFVHYFISDILLRPYVLPESISIPLTPGAAGRHPPPRGLLFVNVVEAVNIPNLDWRSLLSKPDTFVELSVRSRVTKRTHVVWNSRCPKWNEEFRFLVHFPENQVLQIVLKDHDRLLGDTEIGRLQIPIRALPTNAEKDLWTEVQLTHKSFVSLKALKGAMSAMSTQRRGRGSLVAQVNDPGGLGFGNVDSVTPEVPMPVALATPVHEVTPPDEVPTNEEDPLQDGQPQDQLPASPQGGGDDGRGLPPAANAEGYTIGGGGGAAQVDDVSEIEAAPGVCRSGSGTCREQSGQNQPSSGAGASSSTALVPAAGGDRDGNSSYVDAQRRHRDSDPEHTTWDHGTRAAGEAGENTEAGSGSNSPRNRASVDEQVAAARRQSKRDKDACKLHLVLTYVQVGAETVEKARKAAEAARRGAAVSSSQLAGGNETEAKILNALRGGVLEVKLHHPHAHPGVQPARYVVVRVGERKKATAAAKGRKEDEAVATDEVLDFVVDGDLADSPDTVVELEVFDQHWIADEEEKSMWDWESKGQMPTQPARVQVPLRYIATARKLHKAWEVTAGGKALLLDVEFEWLGVLENGGS